MAKLSTEFEREISERARVGRYPSEESYLRAAFGALDEREEIESRLARALTSDNRIVVSREYWEGKRRALLARHPEQSGE